MVRQYTHSFYCMLNFMQVNSSFLPSDVICTICLRRWENISITLRLPYRCSLRLVRSNAISVNSSKLMLDDRIGIPTIRFAQKHAATNLLNLTTVATFFSAVTATTLQFSYASVQLRSEQAVNGFWFCSLVFSIASAVNSLLGLTWKQAI